MNPGLKRSWSEGVLKATPNRKTEVPVRVQRVRVYLFELANLGSKVADFSSANMAGYKVCPTRGRRQKGEELWNGDLERHADLLCRSVCLALGGDPMSSPRALIKLPVNRSQNSGKGHDFSMEAA